MFEAIETGDVSVRQRGRCVAGAKYGGSRWVLHATGIKSAVYIVSWRVEF